MGNLENWIFLFLGLILAYILEFTRPWVKSIYKKSIFSSKQKKTNFLIRELEKARELKDAGFEELVYLALIELANGLFRLTIFVIFAVAGILIAVFDRELIIPILVVIVVSGVYPYVVFRGAFEMVARVKYFEKYKKMTVEEIKKLGGNPEDLDLV